MALPYLTKNVNFCDDLTGKSIIDYLFCKDNFEFDIKVTDHSLNLILNNRKKYQDKFFGIFLIPIIY